MLITQPWGKLYQDRMGLTEEQRATARLQQELYYKRLAFCNPYLWEAVCESHASGDHWPSIDELKKAIAMNSPQPKKEKLIDPDWTNSPEPLALVMAHAKRESVSVRDASKAVLPDWLKQNREHVDYDDAVAFLTSAEGGFGVVRRKEVRRGVSAMSKAG